MVGSVHRIRTRIEPERRVNFHLSRFFRVLSATMARSIGSVEELNRGRAESRRRSAGERRRDASRKSFGAKITTRNPCTCNRRRDNVKTSSPSRKRATVDTAVAVVVFLVAAAVVVLVASYGRVRSTDHQRRRRVER